MIPRAKTEVCIMPQRMHRPCAKIYLGLWPRGPRIILLFKISSLSCQHFSPPCPPSEGNYRFALSFCHSVCLSFCLSRTIVFLTFLGFVSHIRLKLIARFHMQSFTSSSTFITATVDLLFMSYCPLSKIRFPDFSLPCLHISEWKFVASFHMKSYSSSLNSVTIDLLFH